MLVKAGTKYKHEVHAKSKEVEMKCPNPATDEKVEFKASKAKKVEVQSPHPEEVSRSQVKGFQAQGILPDMISWPMYIRIEFIPGKISGEPDQNLRKQIREEIMMEVCLTGTRRSGGT